MNLTEPVGQLQTRQRTEEQSNRSLTTCPGQDTVVSPLRHPLHTLPPPTHLWGRTAAPLPRCQSTAGTGGGTAGDVITGDIVLHRLGDWQAKAGWGPHHPGHLASLLFTGALRCVTFKPSWAAVYVVFTAHSLGWVDRGQWAQGPCWLPLPAQPSPPSTPAYLGERAAAPGPRLQAAAGVAIWAAHLHVTFHLLHCEKATGDRSAVARGGPEKPHPWPAPQPERTLRMDSILRPPTPSSDTKAMTSVEEKGLYMPCPLHAALHPPPLPVFLEQFGGEFLHTEPL